MQKRSDHRARRDVRGVLSTKRGMFTIGSSRGLEEPVSGGDGAWLPASRM